MCTYVNRVSTADASTSARASTHPDPWPRTLSFLVRVFTLLSSLSPAGSCSLGAAQAAFNRCRPPHTAEECFTCRFPSTVLMPPLPPQGARVHPSAQAVRQAALAQPGLIGPWPSRAPTHMPGHAGASVQVGRHGAVVGGITPRCASGSAVLALVGRKA